MAEESKRPECPRRDPPPPCDPFPTYQSPFPRTAGDEENPFIQFRRYADSQIASLFQSFFSAPNPFSSSAAHARWAAIDEEVMRQRQQLEEGWRKQWEQDKEERRMAVEHGTTREMREWGMVKGQDDAASRCPAWQGHLTELDQYEALESPGMPAPEDSTTSSQHGGWLSSMGWDGKQRQHQEGHGRDAVRTTRYTIRKSRDLDPVAHSESALAWILTSPYSPVYLCNARQPLLRAVDVIEQPGQPFRIVQPFFAERVPSATREKLAKQLPWADAFEDLVRLHHQGEMVERDYSTWRTPNTWIHDMVARGSLGPAWAFDGAHRLCRTHYTAPKSETLDDVVTQVANELDSNPLFKSLSEMIAQMAFVPASTVEHYRKVADALRNGEPLPPTDRVTEDEPAAPAPAAAPDPSTDQPESAPPDQPDVSTYWSSSESSSSWSPATEDPKSVVSTLTTTETRTLADGSTETRRVLKQKFADGTESHNESVERQNASAPVVITSQCSSSPPVEAPRLQEDKQTQTPPVPVPVPEHGAERERPRKSGGWFWI